MTLKSRSPIAFYPGAKLKKWEGDFPWIRVQSQKVRTSGGQLKFAISVKEQNGAVSKDTHLLQQTRSRCVSITTVTVLRVRFILLGERMTFSGFIKARERPRKRYTEKTVEREEIRWTNPITRTKNTEYITKRQETSEKPGEGGRREKNQRHSKNKQKQRQKQKQRRREFSFGQSAHLRHRLLHQAPAPGRHLERQGEQEKKKETKQRKARPEEKSTKNRGRG